MDLISKTSHTTLACTDAVGISTDGKFLAAYAGFVLPVQKKKGKIFFCSYDLQAGQTATLEIPTQLTPFIPALTFHALTSTLLVPYSFRVLPQGGGNFELIEGDSRRLDILNLAPNGALARALTVNLPRRTSGSDTPNTIFGFNSVTFSASGAMAFVSVKAGRVFAFDTMSGEIVNEIPLGRDPLTFIHLVEPLGVLVGLSGGVVVADISTGPIIAEVEVGKKQTIIRGANFLQGARVLINGEEVGPADRQPERPGAELRIRQGRKHFPADQPITVVVVNRDNLQSAVVTVTP